MAILACPVPVESGHALDSLNGAYSYRRTASTSPEHALVIYHASSRLKTTDALVPPKPKEFDSTQPSATLSRRSRTIGMSAKAGSRVRMLALSQMKPLFIISSE